MEFNHVSVLLNECLEALNIKEDGIYVDCTLGGAGHSSQIVKRLSNEGRLIGIDQYKDELRAAGERLHNFSNVTFVHNNFHNIGAILEELEIEKVDGILMDLGVSSYQLDEGERGFSYMKDAPLDMRMNRENNFSAYDVVNDYSEEELSGLDEEEKREMLEEYGLEESGLDKLIQASYSLLGLMSFLTAGVQEVRAWTIKQGTKAPQAAGKIHTDIERGFIRAEIVSYDDLVECGSEAAAKEKGLYRLEGKEYVMKDGDIVNFRFNV